MNRTKRVFYYAAAVGFFLLLGGCAAGSTATTDRERPADEQVLSKDNVEGNPSPSVLDDVFFQQRPGKDEILLVFSSMPDDMNLTQPAGTTLVLALKNASPAAGVREQHRPEGPSLVRRVSVRRVAGEAQPGLDVVIELAEIAPYHMHRSGSTVILSFDTAATARPGTPAASVSPGGLRDDEILQAYLERQASRIRDEEPPEFRGDRLSIVTQDTQIRNVFRLISEVSGYSIVAGPDVDQTVTLHMRNVPWDQALETILQVNGLGMTSRGKVITVMPLEKMEKAEEERLKKNVAEGRVRQISIEAKIVEVSTSFSREIGVRWGTGVTGRWDGRDSHQFGMLFGSSEPSINTQVTRLPSGIGVTGSNLAVNFPSALAATTPALGIVAGSSKFVLDAKLQALEATGDGRIISSPKVTTMDNIEAQIEQGESFEVEYEGTDGRATKTVDATLELRVTPRITAEGKISMKIDAKNDYADWERAGQGGIVGPPIMKNRVESTILADNGDTIVIGGIHKSDERTGESGIPWLSDIPALGWLFKEKSVRQDQRELLIFITPVILGE